MKDYKIKIVMNKITLTSELDPNSKVIFDDLNVMVAYVNKKGINITNREVLPPAFQIQLTTNQ